MIVLVHVRPRTNVAYYKLKEIAMVTVNGNHAEFRLFRPQACRVYLTGDFNAWRDGDLLMTCEGGYWRAGIRLSSGVYRFRYVADGQRFIDYAAFGIEPGADGFDGVVRISSAVPTERPG
jgi:1,4-alpha-glucan branching enzyme